MSGPRPAASRKKTWPTRAAEASIPWPSINTSAIAAGDYNSHVYLWLYKLIGTAVDPGSQSVSSVAFSVDDTFLAAGDGNGHVYIWPTKS
jgi:WD40 repeat protein